MRQYFVLEGDYGGQVYATIPVVMTTAERVRQALCVVDALEWFCNDRDGASFYTQEGQSGEEIRYEEKSSISVFGFVLHHTPNDVHHLSTKTDQGLRLTLAL